MPRSRRPQQNGLRTRWRTYELQHQAWLGVLQGRRPSSLQWPRGGPPSFCESFFEAVAAKDSRGSEAEDFWIGVFLKIQMQGWKVRGRERQGWNWR